MSAMTQARPSSGSTVLIRLDDDGIPLLDGVTIAPGSSQALGRFFLAASAQAQHAGATLRLHDDFAGLMSANAQLQDSWDPIVPILDPAHSRLTAQTSFWISAHDAGGWLIATFAARLMEIGPAGLGDEFRSLRLFYDDPAPHIAKGTTCSVTGLAAKAADAITGRVIYAGASWTHPKARGLGLVYILSRIVRYLALARWNTDYTTGGFGVDLASKGILGRYGYCNQAAGIQLRNGYRGDLDIEFIWMDRTWMEAELLGYVAGAAAYRTRDTAAEDTKIPFAERHGKSSRS